MAEHPSFREAARGLLRDHVLDAARDITTTAGWSSLTMGAVATRVGISRQHLYTEIGTKDALGRAMVARETVEFLDATAAVLREHPDDPVAGVEAATRSALVRGADNVLLKAILTAPDARVDTLLPLFTARPDVVLDLVSDRLTTELTALHLDRAAARVDVERCARGIARLVLSHLVQPSGPSDEAVTHVRWLTLGAFPT